MYGLIHTALREMVIDQHGEDVWQRIVSTSGIPSDSFLTMRSYDDSVTYSLAGAAAEVLNASLDDCLTAFGEYWLVHFAPKGYERLLTAAGGNLFDFLESLDSLHDHVSTTFVGYVPPSFSLQRHSDERATLEYTSSRHGFVPFVLGLVKGMQTRFGVDIHFDSIDHEVRENGDHALIRLSVTPRT